MSSLSLRLYTSILDGAIPVPGSEISARVTGWKRSIRSNGGYWLGNFDLTGEISELSRWFNNYLGYHLIERSNGAKTWEGMLYEMELTHRGATRRCSLDTLYNYVTTTYVNTDNQVDTSAAVQNAQSVTKFGRREGLLSYSYLKQAQAEAARDRHLNEYAWPRSIPTGISTGGGDTKLTVYVCGYIFTANWRYEAIGDGTDDNLSDWIREIITNDCATYLLAGSIAENTLQVTKDTDTSQRCWDVIMGLLEQGDADGDPYRCYCYNDRRVNYEQISTTPIYYLRSGEVYTTAGGNKTLDPWSAKPGVMRDTDYPVSKANYNGWLSDARDIYISNVSCGTGSGLSLQTELFSEDEILSAQAEYTARLANESYSTAEGSGSDTHFWEHKIDGKTIYKTKAEAMAAKQSNPSQFFKNKRAWQAQWRQRHKPRKKAPPKPKKGKNYG